MLIRKNITTWIILILIFGIAFCVLFFFQFQNKNLYFIDGDSFYHVGMAKLMMQNGLIMHQFPYLQFTILKQSFVDSHFLFHVLLIPFIRLFGDFNGPKIMTAIFLGLTFDFIYLILKDIKFKLAPLYALILLFILPTGFFFRMLEIRAQVVSLFLLVLGTYLFIKKRPIALSILMIIFVYTYYVASPLIFGLLISYLLIQIIRKEKIDFKLISLPFIAFLLAFIINPYFPGNIHFIYYQISAGFNINSYEGVEHLSPQAWSWASSSAIVLTLFFSGILLSMFENIKHSSKTLAIFGFTILILILQWKSSRFVEYTPVFLGLSGLLLMGDTLEQFLFSINKHLKELKTWIFIILTAAFVQMALINSFWQFNKLNQEAASSKDVPNFQAVSDYLNMNSKYGDLLFTKWDAFSYMFYFDQKNYYVAGLDPVFIQNYNDDLFQKYLSVTFYHPKPDKDISFIKTEFKPQWIMTYTQPNFEKILDEKSNDYKKVFESGPIKLYKAL